MQDIIVNNTVCACSIDTQLEFTAQSQQGFTEVKHVSQWLTMSATFSLVTWDGSFMLYLNVIAQRDWTDP